MDESNARPIAYTAADIGALAHLYRGEVYRSTVWRTRLDATTNWAVVATGIALSVSFSSAQASPLPLALVGLLVAVFLTLEARRYRFFDFWRLRAHVMELHFFGPILRGDVKIRNANGHVGQPFDTLLMGHWHQLLPLFPRLCVNGSLKGYDEFAKLALRAPPEEPQQALWFTHPERGITCHWPVKLGPKRPAAKQDWVSWPKAA